MKLNTAKFGELDVDESKIFNFVLPIIGFDELNKYIILEPSQDTVFKWLQSVEDPELAFPVISVAMLDYDYSVDLSDGVINDLGITNADNVLVLNITSIPQDNPVGTTINLLAPLIFNLENQKAGQIVLSGSGYDISYPMFKKN